eukprot:448902_1
MTEFKVNFERKEHPNDVEDAMDQLLNLNESSPAKMYEKRYELMKFLNETDTNNKETIILKNTRFFNYLNYSVIYWSMPICPSDKTTADIELTKNYETIQELIVQTVQLCNTLCSFMKNTPWYYNNNIYKIYKTLYLLMECTYQTYCLFLLTELDQIYGRYILNETIILQCINTINNSIISINTNGTQYLYEFIWWDDLISFLMLTGFDD